MLSSQNLSLSATPASSPSLKVVIVSPNHVSIAGMRRLFAKASGYQVIHVCSAPEALVSFGQTNALNIDAVIIDEDIHPAHLFCTSWVQLLPGFNSACVLMLASRPGTVRGSIRLDSQMSADELKQVIDDGMNQSVETTRRRGVKSFLSLTPSEQGVISGLLLGMTVSDMAAGCGKSVKTISAQKQSALRKLQIKNLLDLYSYFYKETR